MTLTVSDDAPAGVVSQACRGVAARRPGQRPAMSILGKLIGTAQTTARGTAAGRGRPVSRPTPGMGTRRGLGRRPAAPAVPAAGGGLGRLLGSLTRRR